MRADTIVYLTTMVLYLLFVTVVGTTASRTKHQRHHPIGTPAGKGKKLPLPPPGTYPKGVPIRPARMQRAYKDGPEWAPAQFRVLVHCLQSSGCTYFAEKDDLAEWGATVDCMRNIGMARPQQRGLARLLKAVLVLQHEQAPPNPELKSLNPKIAAVVEGFPVRFPTELEPLRPYSDKPDGEALVAGVSSFGAYGTIAHVLVSQPTAGMARGPPLLESTSETTSGERPESSVTTGVLFMFTGQGSQYEGMGRGLYDAEPAFKAALDQCEAIFTDATGESLLEVMYPPAAATGAAEEKEKVNGQKSSTATSSDR